MLLLQRTLVFVCLLGQLVGTCYAEPARSCCDADGARQEKCDSVPAIESGGDACCDGGVRDGVLPAAGAREISERPDARKSAGSCQPEAPAERTDPPCPAECDACLHCACCMLHMTATAPGAPLANSSLVPHGVSSGVSGALLHADPGEIPHVPRRGAIRSASAAETVWPTAGTPAPSPVHLNDQKNAVP